MLGFGYLDPGAVRMKARPIELTRSVELLAVNDPVSRVRLSRSAIFWAAPIEFRGSVYCGLRFGVVAAVVSLRDLMHFEWGRRSRADAVCSRDEASDPL